MSSPAQPSSARAPRLIRVLPALALNAALTLAFALYLRLTRAHHFGPHANGHPITRRNFADLLDFAPQFQHYHSSMFFQQQTVFLQPLPLAALYKIFLSAGPLAIPLYVAALLLTMLAAAALFARALVCRGIPLLRAAAFTAVAFIFAWPFWFCLKQGNLEFALFTLIALGAWSLWRGHHTLASICFAIAGSLKLYPLVFLALPLAQKRYRAVLAGLITFAAVNLAALWLACPQLAVSWQGSLTGLRILLGHGYALARQSAQSGMDHSLFALLKTILAVLAPQHLADSAFMHAFAIVYVVVVAATGLLLWMTRIRPLPLANQLLSLTVAAILLPPLSFEYTLMQLYVPWAVLILAALSTDIAAQTRTLQPALLILAVLLSPLFEFTCGTWGLAGPLKALLLLALFTLALRRPFAAEGTAAASSSAPSGSPNPHGDCDKVAIASSSL